jgi:DNA modification methylase
MTAIFLEGNAKNVLAGLPSDFVHCVVTSPPYFGLRRYSGGEEVWDGDGKCQHEWGVPTHPPGYRGTDTHPGPLQNAGTWNRERLGGPFCLKCGAWRGQLGNEPTPDLYISHLIQIMREVKRVLRPDGVFWLNIGDSWAGYWGDKKALAEGRPSHADDNGWTRGFSMNSRPKFDKLCPFGIKPLDMILIPSQLALAARADGWYVRSMVCWSKSNPMPESVNGWRFEKHRVKVAQSSHELSVQSIASDDGIGRTTAGLNARKGRGEVDGWQDCPGCPKCSPNDGLVLRKGSWRSTDSYEFILMLTKTDNYYCDREAVLEPIAPSTVGRGKVDFGGSKGREYQPDENDPNFRNGSEQWGRTYDYAESNSNGGRNLRSVWSFPTAPFKGAHFATYPPKLVELCVKSSTSERGCCPECGAPWARVVEKPEVPHDGDTECKNPDEQGNSRRLALMRQAAGERGGEYSSKSKTVNWRPTCSCGAGDPVPCRVLDCFSGAGTTALVCERLGLGSFSIDTSAEYIELSRKRLVEDEEKRIAEFIKAAKSNGHKREVRTKQRENNVENTTETP